MDTIITTGDFDFNIFATTPGPTVKEKVPVTEAKATQQKGENKRKLDEVDTRPTPSWIRGANRNNDPRSANGSAPTQEKGRFDNKRAKYNTPQENKETDTTSKSNIPYKNNKNDKNKNNENKGGETPKFEQSNFKQAWEPDASDFKNVIAIEKTSDSMFTGDWDSLGLNKRVVSTITNNMKLPQPTHIQHAAIPQILNGHDVLVKAETGSGKTLTYVLPVLHALGNIEPHINRKDGAYAIVIAPTRELVSQIYEVVCQVAKTWIWVVPGYLSGGENKDTEKTRLRKGVNVLVSTPGRLIDHLTTTSCFKFDKLQFLVLDEADRLLDLGFGPKIAEIVGILERPPNSDDKNNNRNTRHSNYGNYEQWENKNNNNGNKNNNSNNNFGKNDISTEETEESGEKKEGDKAKERVNKAVKFTYEDEDELEKPSLKKKFQTILASATLHNGVRQLAALTLKEPYYIGLKPQAVNQSTKHARVDIETGQEYNTPANLRQYYCITKTKERLSSLVTLLQQCAKNKQKVVVFVASCDIVDYYYVLLNGVNADPSSLERKSRHGRNEDSDEDEEEKESSEDEDGEGQEKEDEEEGEKKEGEEEGEKKPHVPLIEAPIYKLHGDLSQVERNNAYNRFRKDEAAILISTDVSARGLDFPDVHWIVQYDPPADTKDYIHRVGRTARMGREGSSLLYLIPEEEGYVPYLKNLGLTLESRTVPPSHTTQLLIERFVEDDKTAFKLARAAYVSSVRAYSTHTTATKHIFSLSNLHVGHLAKAYGLRDRPSELSGALKNQMKGKKKAQVVEKKMKQTKRIFRAPPVERAAANEFDAGLE